MLNTVKFILLAQSYTAAFFLMAWQNDNLQFAPWWIKAPVVMVVCIFLLAPVVWMHLDNEQHKDNSRRLERLQYLEKKHYFSD
ncbi:MAG: hypothetical protein CME80_08535 [Halomonas sp.]|nr:hypothetical protein [Halomonas sp.]MBF57751.1 hypothetical protein [Halomonas sp.]|tara:strand:+ start:80 stop:328 length:249 start_codon:yes stop_codon:yes gene_type:complete